MGHKFVQEELNKAVDIILPVTFCSCGTVGNVASVIRRRKLTASPELIVRLHNLQVRRGGITSNPKTVLSNL
jgi:hypothetical protein